MFVDYTDLLKSECSKLKMGQIVKAKSFTMRDALCAIEMMDSKMNTDTQHIDKFDLDILSNINTNHTQIMDRAIQLEVLSIQSILHT